MVKTFERSYAPSLSTDLLRLNRLKAVPLCERFVVRLQVNNVLARNCSTTGVQGAPKSLIGSIVRNVETLSLRPMQRQAGITVRRTVGVATMRMLEKAKAVL